MHSSTIIFRIINNSCYSSCYQNIGNPNSFACGLMKAQSPVNNVVYIIMEVAYVLIWTYLLNLLCKKAIQR